MLQATTNTKKPVNRELDARKLEKQRDAQKAFEYDLYTILSTCFPKASCVSLMMEDKLKIRYKAHKEEARALMDEACIRYIETELLKKLPQAVFEQAVTVKLVRKAHWDKTILRFEGPAYCLDLAAKYIGGKHADFHYRLAKQSGRDVQHQAA